MKSEIFSQVLCFLSEVLESVRECEPLLRFILYISEFKSYSDVAMVI
jgi:hypothetical protein